MTVFTAEACRALCDYWDGPFFVIHLDGHPAGNPLNEHDKKIVLEWLKSVHQDDKGFF